MKAAVQGPLLALAAAATLASAHDHEHHIAQALKLAAARRVGSSGPKLASSAASDAASPRRPSLGSGLKVGDEVCITGYIMDNYCIYNNGEFPNSKLLDASDITTLKEPEKHSNYCLLDVKPCYESGYQVLGPKDPETGLHSPGYRIDDTDAVLAAGRALGKKGKCTTCTNEDEGAADFGWEATIKGKVAEPGDGSDTVEGPPLLTDVTIMGADAGCGEEPAPAPAPEEPSGASVRTAALGALALAASLLVAM